MNHSSPGRLVIVTGLSGSGKSTALKALEDIGYLTIDNLPSALLPKFLAIRKESGGFIRMAVGMDAREPGLVQSFRPVWDEARAMGYDLSLLFLEAGENALVSRFSETRRPHHLAKGGDILSAIRRERDYLAPLRLMADTIIDSTSLKGHALRDMVIERFSPSGERPAMTVEILSFGFKNGLPPEADLMVDVRFLPNPFYLDRLRSLNGRDQPVRDYVLNAPETEGFLERFLDMLEYLLPLYRKEGKTYLTVAIGCTGGQHRSVAVAGFLWEKLKGLRDGWQVNLRHRDLG